MPVIQIIKASQDRAKGRKGIKNEKGLPINDWQAL